MIPDGCCLGCMLHALVAWARGFRLLLLSLLMCHRLTCCYVLWLLTECGVALLLVCNRQREGDKEPNNERAVPICCSSSSLLSSCLPLSELTPYLKWYFQSGLEYRDMLRHCCCTAPSAGTKLPSCACCTMCCSTDILVVPKAASAGVTVGDLYIGKLLSLLAMCHRTAQTQIVAPVRQN